jgi:hypothetical protein
MESGILKSPVIIINLSVSPFNSLNICCICLEDYIYIYVYIYVCVCMYI